MPRRPNTPAQPERSPDQGRALLLRNLPPDMHRHIRRAAADADTSLEGYVKRLIELDMAQASPGPANGYKFEFAVTGDKVVRDNADRIMAAIVELVESWGGTVGGGFHRIDDHEPPNA